jgi:hypothetical protein
MDQNKEMLKASVWDVDMNTSLNEQYFQKLAFYFAVIDRVNRILVGVLAFASIITYQYTNISLWLSIGGFIVAIILNVLSFHQWELTCRMLQSEWSELRSDLQKFERDAYGTVFDLTFLIRTKNKFDEPLPKGQHERLSEITTRRNELNARDFVRWQWLIDRTWAEEVQRRYGPGVITPEQQREAIEKLRPIYGNGSPAVA